jgi:hypothetical protein
MRSALTSCRSRRPVGEARLTSPSIGAWEGLLWHQTGALEAIPDEGAPWTIRCGVAGGGNTFTLSLLGEWFAPAGFTVRTAEVKSASAAV